MVKNLLERYSMDDVYNKSEKKDLAILLPLINELKTMFSDFFNQNWFFILLDNSNIQSRTLYDIIDILKQDFSLQDDSEKIIDLTQLLTRLFVEVKQTILPDIREKLQISGFQKNNINFDQNEYLRRIFIAEVFPDNLKRLEEIIIQLRAELNMDVIEFEENNFYQFGINTP